MATLLRLDTSARHAGSRSRELGDHVVARLHGRDPALQVVVRDLAVTPAPLMSAETIAGFYATAETMTDAQREATAASDALIAELLEAEALLVTAPMYNFGGPAVLKAWVDQVVRLNRTFAYDGTNFVGLVTGRPAYLALVHGVAGYAAGGKLATLDFLRPYLEGLLRFIGFTELHVFSVEATAADADIVARGMALARDVIDRSLFHPAQA